MTGANGCIEKKCCTAGTTMEAKVDLQKVCMFYLNSEAKIGDCSQRKENKILDLQSQTINIML